MSLTQKFQTILQQYDTPLADRQKSYLPHLKTAIATLNATGDFHVELLLAQSGAVTLGARKTGWREDRFVTLTEDSLDKIYRATPQDAADHMAETIVTELAHTLARAQRTAQMKYLLGR